ncbi:MAG: hypothetical protein HQK79_17980 [Desulfobacterales bacterium]|nr:hypothetical protein [Desulfobacterales bacterium]
MNIKLEVVHKMSGRVRVKIKSHLEPSIFFMIIESVLPEIKKIKRAELNRYAQSITIYFKQNDNLDEILEELKTLITMAISDPILKERLEEIKYEKLNTGNVILRDKILTINNGLNDTVKNFTGNITDMKMTITTGSFLAGLGMLVLAPEFATPAWLVLLIFSTTSFNQANSSNKILCPLGK